MGIAPRLGFYQRGRSVKRRNAHEGRPPAWPKYARDWLTSEAVLAMPRAARSLYDDLLSYQWLNGSLPSDIPTLARMTGETVESFTELWKHVEPQFDKGEDGRLRNHRQQHEWEESAAIREARSEAGKRGADASNGKRSAKPPANEQQEGGNADILPTGLLPAKEHPSASASSAVSERAVGNARSTRAREGDPSSGNPHDEFREWWLDRYAKATNGTRLAWKPADASAANELLGLARATGRGFDLVREVLERLIAHPKFGRDAPTLPRAVGLWATLVAAPSPAKATAKPALEETPEQVELRNRWFVVHSRRGAVPDYPGHEAARLRLAEIESQARERTGAA